MHGSDRPTAQSIARAFRRAAPRAEKPVRDAPAYTLVARTLHWVTAALILILVPSGIVIAEGWGGGLQDVLYNAHRSVGALLIPIVVARLIYRRARPPAPLPNEVPAIQRIAAEVTHAALYILLVAQPLAGWMATSAYPAPITLFGRLKLPPIWVADRAFSEQLFAVHRMAGIILACLVVAHFLAALYHQLVRKDRVLMRMITG
jgi:cytochrome b561